MKKSPLFNRPRARVTVPSVTLTDAMRDARIAHCGGDLRPHDPTPSCRFCGGDCDGDCD